MEPDQAGEIRHLPEGSGGKSREFIFSDFGHHRIPFDGDYEPFGAVYEFSRYVAGCFPECFACYDRMRGVVAILKCYGQTGISRRSPVVYHGDLMSFPTYLWYLVLFSFSLGWVSMCIPPVAGQFMDLFGVGYGGLSFFLSAFFWTQSLIQIPAGVLIDRLGVVRSMILWLGVALLSSLIPLVAPHNMVLGIIARCCLGMSAGAMFLVTVKIVKILVPPTRISRVQGIQGATFSLGTMIPYLVLPSMGAYGWAVCYIICGFFCLLLILGMFRLPLRMLEENSISGASAAEMWRSLKTISGSRSLWFIGVCHGLSYGSLFVIGNWLPAILVDIRPGSTLADFAIITGVLLLLGTMGRAFGGELIRLIPRPFILRRTMLLVGIIYCVTAFAPTPLFVILLALPLAILCGCTYSPVFTLTIDIAQPAYVATSVGLMNMIAIFVNVMLTIVFGNVRDVTGTFAPGLVGGGGIVLVFWFLSRKLSYKITADLKERRKPTEVPEKTESGKG